MIRMKHRLHVLLSLLLIGWSTSVLAHHPTISAEGVCVPGAGLVIDYESTSFDTTGYEGVLNSQIDILFNSVVVGSGAYTADALTFYGSAPAPSASGPGDSVAVSAVAVADWGDGAPGGQSESIMVVLPGDDCDQGDGRFTGGGHQIRVDGVRVTRGLTIHCDLLLSNNLEVNWGGNQFHMTEHLLTTQCSDDPLIDQFPPAAPLDTLVGVGTGRFNGEDGYTIEFILQDWGEPGDMDQMGILIYETANPSNVVLDVPQQVLDGGNLQAHYDQPHM